MKRSNWFYLAALVLAFGIWKSGRWHPTWRQNFSNSLTLTLYSLEPENEYWPRNTPKDAPKMDDSLILGSTTITDASEKAQLLAAMDENMDAKTSCIFAPRHALESADKKTQLLVCFECGIGTVDGQHFPSDRNASFSPQAAPVFNAILKKHGVPLSHLGQQNTAQKALISN